MPQNEPSYEPSEQEITDTAALLRREWSERVRRIRAGLSPNATIEIKSVGNAIKRRNSTVGKD